MRRRELMLLLGGAMTVPRVLRAQQKAMPVIGWLHSASPGEIPRSVAAFRQGLSETGWVDGQNVTIKYRWAEGHYDRLPALAADLVSYKVAVIATNGPAARAAKDTTRTIPVVFTGVTYPVKAGLVASLARPGGNLTGFSILGGELTPKRLQIMHDLVPDVTTIALLVESNRSGGATGYFTDKAVENAATRMGLQVPILEAGAAGDFEPAFAKLGGLRAGALVVDSGALFFYRRDELVALASRYAVPASYFEPEIAEAGGLISFGPRPAAVWREVGIYVGKILNGAEPGDLPVQQPTKFELVINLNTAKALGLTIPESILVRADEVIE
jgi:putative ABC transport system substrate-binding protein